MLVAAATPMSDPTFMERVTTGDGFISTARSPNIRLVNGMLRMSRCRNKPRSFQLKKNPVLTVFIDQNDVVNYAKRLNS